MECLNIVISVVNSLRDKGLTHYAAELDRFLCKHAQELKAPGMDPLAGLEAAEAEQGGAEPMGPMAEIPIPEQAKSEVPSERNKLQNTLYYQFERWHGILDRELPKFDYFGKENIAAIRSALSNVHQALRQALQNKPKQYDKQSMDKWSQEIEELVNQMHKSQQAKLDETKAIVDANLLYNTTNRMNESCKRICGDDPTFSNVVQEFDNLMHVFSNVVKSVSEQVAERDLTKVR